MILELDHAKIKSTLKQTSYDESGKVCFLTDETEVLDFDEVSKQIAAKLRHGNKLRSCDALYFGSEYIYLIELKNRKSSDLKKCKPELFEKAFDSVYQLMLGYRPDETIDSISKKVRLVVIYNDKKVADSAETNIPESPSVDKTTQKLKELSKKTGLDSLPQKFGLNKLEGKLYEKIITLDVANFTPEVKSLIFA